MLRLMTFSRRPPPQKSLIRSWDEIQRCKFAPQVYTELIFQSCGKSVYFFAAKAKLLKNAQRLKGHAVFICNLSTVNHAPVQWCRWSPAVRLCTNDSFHQQSRYVHLNKWYWVNYKRSILNIIAKHFLKPRKLIFFHSVSRLFTFLSARKGACREQKLSWDGWVY